MSQRDAQWMFDSFHSTSYVKITLPFSIGCGAAIVSYSTGIAVEHVVSGGASSIVCVCARARARGWRRPRDPSERRRAASAGGRAGSGAARARAGGGDDDGDERCDRLGGNLEGTSPPKDDQRRRPLPQPLASCADATRRRR